MISVCKTQGKPPPPKNVLVPCAVQVHPGVSHPNGIRFVIFENVVSAICGRTPRPLKSCCVLSLCYEHVREVLPSHLYTQNFSKEAFSVLLDLLAPITTALTDVPSLG